MQIEIGMDPTLFELGPYVLAWHGLLSVIAIAVGLWIMRIGMRERAISLAGFDSFIIWSLISGVAGARILYVIDHFDRFRDDPLEIFAITSGGLAIYGGVLGGFATVAFLSRRRGYPFGGIIDSIAPGLAVGQAIGRIGCAINGDAWGAKTDSPFAFVYTNPDAIIPNRLLNVPTHPYPIYDLLMNLAIFAIIWPMRHRKLPRGAIFAIFTLLYAATRFVISYVREERVWFWGLQEAQVIALVLLIAAGLALLWLMRRPIAARPTAGV